MLTAFWTPAIREFEYESESLTEKSTCLADGLCLETPLGLMKHLSVLEQFELLESMKKYKPHESFIKSIDMFRVIWILREDMFSEMHCFFEFL